MINLLTWLFEVYKEKLTQLIFIVITGTLSNSIGPVLIQYAIDNGYNNYNVNIIVICVILFLLTRIISHYLTYLQTLLITTISTESLHKTRTLLFRHIVSLPMKIYEKFTAGKLIVRSISDVDSLSELIQVGINMLSNLFTIGFVIALMLYYNLKLTIFTLTGVILGGLFYYIYKQVIFSLWKELREKFSHLGGFISESISGLSVIRKFNRQEQIKNEFTDLHEDFTKTALKVVTRLSFFHPSTGLFANFYLCILLWLGGYMIQDHSITFGSFIAFWYLLNKLIMPFRSLADNFNVIIEAGASKERIDEILNETPEKAEGIKIDKINTIEFENIKFAYSGDKYLINGITFRLEKPQKIAIIGKTGSGKSTLANLLLRLYEGYEGSIKVNGIELTDIHLESLRKKIVFLSQEYRKSDNKSFGEQQIHSINTIDVNKFDVIILDEATSNIDPLTEQTIQKTILKNFKDKLIIIISHRLSSIRIADNIFYLKDGNFQNQGKLTEIVKNDKDLRRIYDLQLIGGAS